MKQTDAFCLDKMIEYERSLTDCSLIAGMDEAGRGPLAGPVFAACVIMPDEPIEGVRDSKQISEKKRFMLADIIKYKAVSYGIGWADIDEIETYNILGATKLAMKRAWDNMGIKDAFLIIDAINPDFLEANGYGIIKGDQKCYSVAAASILAKTARDELIKKIAEQYPQYGFCNNKGYGTKEHIQALKLFGACPEHRPSFIRKII